MRRSCKAVALYHRPVDLMMYTSIVDRDDGSGYVPTRSVFAA